MTHRVEDPRNYPEKPPNDVGKADNSVRLFYNPQGLNGQAPMTSCMDTICSSTSEVYTLFAKVNE